MSDSKQEFCNITWEPRFNDGDQVMTMPQMKSRDGSHWQMFTVGCLGVVRIDFADVEAWAKLMRHWVDSVEKQVQAHRDARTNLGLETQ